MASLPSSTEICQSVGSDDAEVQSSLLRLLVFATDTSRGVDFVANTKHVSNVLVEAWTKCIDLEDSLVDALWLQSCMWSAVPEGEETQESSDSRRRAQEALVEIIQAILKVPDRRSLCDKLKANLLPHFLGASGLTSEEDLLKRLRIHNTQVNYKQQKYNLLQEETEGYAKLISFLAARSGCHADQLATIRRLIGTFELDPSRVMDLVVDVLESELYPEGTEKESSSTKPNLSDAATRLLGLIRHLPVEQLPSVLSFKLAVPGTPSQSLCRVVALLASEGILDFSVLYQEYSVPIDEEINEAYSIMWMMEKQRIQALTRISLSGAIKEDPKLTELKERFQKELLRLLSNATIHILWLLLQWGEFDEVKPLIISQSWEKLCCILPEKFGFAFCDIAQKRLDPWLAGLVGTPGLSIPVETGHKHPIPDKRAKIDDVVRDVSEFLRYTLYSGCIQYRPVLYCQLCRVMRSSLQGGCSEQVPNDETYQFFKLFMVPSLSLFGANPSISSELWSVLQRMPYAIRYRLYDDWKGKGLERMGLGVSPLSGKPLPVAESEINAGKAARYALKRLSKDNIRDMSRLLAKATHSAPLVVYGTILSQIESYDNMVDVMVEAQRFSNPLSLDVLGFCMLSRLSGTTGGVNRNRLKEDGVNVSQWLQSLEAFSGAFFKRFPFIEFRGILSYLMRRLRAGKVMELGILASLLKVAGGYGFADYSPAASLSVSQLEGRAGSFALKRETMTFGIVEDMNQRATDTIKKVLQSDGLGVSMLMLIAQARSRIIFESTNAPPKPVKLIGNLVDTCQIVISILLEFLTTDENDGDGCCTAIEEYAKQLPPLEDLHSKFGLDVESSWMLTRPLARYAARKNWNETLEATDFATQTSSFRKKYEGMLSDEAWTNLSPALFETFYTNSLYDIFFPEEVYISELGRLAKEIERLERPKTGAPSGTVQMAAKDENQHLERLKKVHEALTSDREKQRLHVQTVRDELEERKNDLILSDVVSHQASKALLIHCVYPRTLQGPDDALYCAHFALRLHHIETLGFSMLHYIDELVSLSAGSLYAVTEAEAANLAILLWQTWSVINRWRYEDGVFDEEVAGKPGSFMEQSTDSNPSEQREISHKDFIVLYNSWHAALGSALIGCIESKEYIHTRSGLVVLTRLVDVFPTQPKLGNVFLSTLEPLQDETSDRPDIRAAANAYSTMLLKARDDGKWKEEDASVAKARADKEKIAADARKKKLEERFEELQRDTEKITVEIGPDRRRDGRNSGGRGSAAPDRGRDARDRRSPPREPERRRDRDIDRGLDRGPPSRVSDRRAGDRGGHREGLEEGRWARGEVAPPSDDRVGRGSKRGRGSSPEVGVNDRGDAKRARLEQPNSFEPRRYGGRGASPPPPRRDRSGPESSRSSRQGRRR